MRAAHIFGLLLVAAPAFSQTVADTWSVGGAVTTIAYRWDGSESNGAPAAAGVYFVRVRDGQASASRKIVRIR